MLTVTYAECHIKTPYAECHQAECRGALVLDSLFGQYDTNRIGSIHRNHIKNRQINGTYLLTCFALLVL